MDPQSPDEWFLLVEQHEATALAMQEHRTAAGQAIFHAGLAAEAALKALIMRREGLNRWPDRDDRPDLYSHNLYALMRIAGVNRDPQDVLAPSWHTIGLWNRGQGYDPMPTPIKVAKAFVKAALGAEGVVPWIRSQI